MRVIVPSIECVCSPRVNTPMFNSFTVLTDLYLTRLWRPATLPILSSAKRRRKRKSTKICVRTATASTWPRTRIVANIICALFPTPTRRWWPTLLVRRTPSSTRPPVSASPISTVATTRWWIIWTSSSLPRWSPNRTMCAPTATATTAMRWVNANSFTSVCSARPSMRGRRRRSVPKDCISIRKRPSATRNWPAFKL